jgi:hypothetical protein
VLRHTSAMRLLGAEQPRRVSAPRCVPGGAPARWR